MRGKGYKKFPSPEQNQGWDTKYSTVPPWLQLALPLIDAVTGVTGAAFPLAQLGKWYRTGQCIGILTPNGFLSEALSQDACLSS